MKYDDKNNTFPLHLSVSECKGVGPKIASLLQNLAIYTVGDLLYHFPRTYLDRRNIIPVGSISSLNRTAVVQGYVSAVRSYRPARRLHIVQCTVRDESGSLKVVWFNQPYLWRALHKGINVILSGNVSDRRGLQMENPDVEILSASRQSFLNTLGLVPVYPLTEGIGQRKLRRLVHTAIENFLDRVPENLPSCMVGQECLIGRVEALRHIHFPQCEEDIAAAHKRIAFEEFIALQLCLQSADAGGPDGGIAHSLAPTLTETFRSNLPFRPTPAQDHAIERIFRAMESDCQMNILLQGDVGSGKTLVAAFSMLRAVENKRQAVMMAPTEILAEQHASTLSGLMGDMGVPVAVLTANQSTPERERALSLFASGQPALIVGTHALVYPKKPLPNVSLIIIDEQHRFGVNQRALLREKAPRADLIVMTATPIPRTLALTLYGRFETVLIDRLPPGRQKVETAHVREADRRVVVEAVREAVDSGRQAIVVCPEIGDQQTKRSRSPVSVHGTYVDYRKAFPKVEVGLLHGRLTADERTEILERFRRNDIRILVATTIIEVGVDVPNATVMVIENADKFGLAQLHQLMGRVGRARYDSRCFLLAEPTTPEACKRIEIMTTTTDGFTIAEEDLLLRGPGEFLGSAQSGLPPLRLGHLLRDAALMEQAREAAARILASDPHLESVQNEPLTLLPGLVNSEFVQL